MWIGGLGHLHELATVLVPAAFVQVSVQCNISANTTPILSHLLPTLRIGFLGHLHELVTVLGTFVPITFVSVSVQWNIVKTPAQHSLNLNCS